MGWLRKIRGLDPEPYNAEVERYKWLANLPPEERQRQLDEPWWSDPEAIQQMHAEGCSNWSYSDWDRFNLARAAAKEDRRISQQKAALEADELRRSNAVEAERRRNVGRGAPEVPSAAQSREPKPVPTENPDPPEDLDLKGLAELFKDGLLTEEEWMAAKKRILNP